MNAEPSDFPNKAVSLAVFISHPIQHFAPLFKELARVVDLHVFYYSDFAQKSGQVDPGFGVPVKWNVPLLEGYGFTFLDPVPWQKRSYLGPWKQNRDIYQQIRNRSWDGILLFGYSYISDWLVWLSANLKHVPILLLSDSELLHKRAWPKQVIKEVPVRLFMSRISRFLAVGDNNRLYAHRYGIPDERISTAALPIDTERFRLAAKSSNHSARIDALRQKYQIPEDAKVVIFCGKLAPHKRPLDVVLALNNLKGMHIVGLFIGDGVLKQEVLEIGKSRVRVTGFVNQEEIVLHYALGDVLIVPSERDAHPLVITEAASLGIPSIVSDRVGCVGSNDMVRENETGLVYPCGDINALAGLLETLLNDENLRNRLGKRALAVSAMQNPVFVARSILQAVISLVEESRTSL